MTISRDARPALIADKCWICGGPATSGEHKIKKSDLRAMFARPSQKSPLYVSTAKARNVPAGSFDADKLKSPAKLCAECNNARTQEHDRAWERLSARLQQLQPNQESEIFIRANRVFSYDTRRKMTDVQLYFVKLFGCHIVEGGIEIDLASFSDAILKSEPHPHIYLQFCIARLPFRIITAGMSEMHLEKDTGGKCVSAVWAYYLGNVVVSIMFASDGIMREGMHRSWHPKFGTNKLMIKAILNEE